MCYIIYCNRHRSQGNTFEGDLIRVSITKVGGVTEDIDSFNYMIPLMDRRGYTVQILAYDLDRITTDIMGTEAKHVSKLFKGVIAEEL